MIRKLKATGGAMAKALRPLIDRQEKSLGDLGYYDAGYYDLPQQRTARERYLILCDGRGCHSIRHMTDQEHLQAVALYRRLWEDRKLAEAIKATQGELYVDSRGLNAGGSR